jgi:uncharacterized protein YcaQ
VTVERRPPDPGALRGADQLHAARQQERAGRIAEAIGGYEAAALAAAETGAWAVQAEALRRLGVLLHHRNEPVAAREAFRRSYDVAQAAGDTVLAAQALNALALLALERGELEVAGVSFRQELVVGLEC